MDWFSFTKFGGSPGLMRIPGPYPVAAVYVNQCSHEHGVQSSHRGPAGKKQYRLAKSQAQMSDRSNFATYDDSLEPDRRYHPRMPRNRRHPFHRPVNSTESVQNFVAKFVAARFDRACHKSPTAASLRLRQSLRGKVSGKNRVGISGASAAGLARCAYRYTSAYTPLQQPPKTQPATEELSVSSQLTQPVAKVAELSGMTDTVGSTGRASHATTGSSIPHGSKKYSDEYTGVDRRVSADRRSYSLKTMWICLVDPRRSKGRRKTDRRYPLLDVFDGSSMFLAVALVTLSLLDAFFTLNILARGGSEVNPVMNYMLGHGTAAFVASKMLMTALAIIALVATGNIKLFNRFRVRSIHSALIGLYAGLIVYELILLSMA